MVGIYVYRSLVVPIGHTGKVMPMLIISLVGLGRTGLTLILLLIYILAIVDLDYYSNIYVETVRTVFIIEYILDFLLKAVIEELYKPFLVKVSP